jgi:hypothetical protein
MKRLCVIAILLWPMCGHASTLEQQADELMDVLGMYTACQVFAGASDREAMEKGREFGRRMIDGFLDKRPELVKPLMNLVPGAGARFQKQVVFLRNLSWENRKEICFGMEDTFRKLPTGK